jgi:DNA-binding response OmpR family regulator
MIPQETLRELVQLRERVADLEAEIATLRAETRSRVEVICRALDVSVGQGHLLLAFAENAYISHAQISAYILRDISEDAEMHDVRSRIKRLRRRVPWLKIKPVYGLGYEVEDESLERLRATIRSGGKQQ